MRYCDGYVLPNGKSISIGEGPRFFHDRFEFHGCFSSYLCLFRCVCVNKYRDARACQSESEITQLRLAIFEQRHYIL